MHLLVNFKEQHNFFRILFKIMEDHDATIQLYSLSRGDLDEGEIAGKDYSAIMRRNHFKVDRPIVLLGLGFFGPVEKAAEYDVTYDVRSVLGKPKFNFFGCQNGIQEHIFGSGRIQLTAKKNEIMYLGTGELRIPANAWIEIGFSLNGPKTGRMKDCSVMGICTETAKGKVQFNFLAGSKQMPQMFFKVDDEITLKMKTK